MASPALRPAPPDLLERLRTVAGREAVLTGLDAEPYVHDIYRRGETPLAVVRPATVEALAAAVAEATSAGAAVYPRGGGASYTDGYLPDRGHAVIVDTGRLNRIVEINVEDAYVTVEAGVTWAELKAALDPLGLRTPFFGPFSGLAATVGGSVSQNSLSHGSGAHGISAQSVLSLDVVIASGEVIRTGSAARGSPPFARFYGPDLAGLFTGDCGALGVKARITLPLLRKKAAFACASFAFSSLESLAAAMREAAMEGLEDEHFAIDAALAQGQIARQEGAGAAVRAALAILRTSPSLPRGLLRLARLGLAGTGDLAAAEFTLHFILEGVAAGEVNAKLSRLRALMHEGVEIANSVPTFVRGMPFAPLFNVLGPKGERWVPLHGLLPHSRVAPFHAALEALYAERGTEMKRLGVWKGGMFQTVNPSAMLYEVALYWPGAHTDYHRAQLPAEHLASLPAYAHDDDTAAFVETLKTDIVQLMGRFGAVHFQIGKTYPYAGVLSPEPLALIKAVKAAVDPRGLMNPGALGL